MGTEGWKSAFLFFLVQFSNLICLRAATIYVLGFVIFFAPFFHEMLMQDFPCPIGDRM